MTYVHLVYDNETQSTDFAVDDRGFISMQGGWATPILLSLGTDRYSPYFPIGERRGWWADAYPDEAHPGDEWGSWIWTHKEGGVVTASVARKCAGAGEASLQWMKTDGAAARVSVTGAVEGPDIVAIAVDIVDQNGVKLYGEVWRV